MAEDEGKPVEEVREDSVDVDALMDELKKINLTDPKKLRGKLQNAEGYKTIQGKKDRLANEVQSLRGEIEQMRIQSTHKVNIDEFGDIQQNPIDLEAAIESVMDRRDEKRKKQQLEFEKAQAAAYREITSDEDWEQVKGIYEKKISENPELGFAIRSGSVDPVKLYYTTKSEYLKDLAKRAYAAFQTSEKNPKVNPPHVEGNAKAPTQESDDRTDKQKKVDELREKAKAPMGLHQDDQMDLINAALGDFIGR